MVITAHQMLLLCSCPLCILVKGPIDTFLRHRIVVNQSYSAHLSMHTEPEEGEKEEADGWIPYFANRMLSKTKNLFCFYNCVDLYFVGIQNDVATF